MGEKEAGDKTEIEEWKQQAAEIAVALEPFDEFAFGRAYRAMYYDSIDDKLNASEDWLQAYEISQSTLFGSWLGGWMAKEGRREEVANVLGGDSVWAVDVMADQQDRQDALETYEKLKANGSLGIQDEIWWLHDLILMGAKQESKEAWLELGNTEYPDVFNLDYPLQLFSGQRTPEQLKEDARQAGSRRWMAAAHFYVAAYYLRQNPDAQQREAAKQELNQCLALDVFMDNCGYWAQAILDRMDKYPDWPNRPANGERGD